MPRCRRPLEHGRHRGPILHAFLRRSSHTPAWCLLITSRDTEGRPAKIATYWEPGDPTSEPLARLLGLPSADDFERVADALPALVGREITFHRDKAGLRLEGLPHD